MVSEARAGAAVVAASRYMPGGSRIGGRWLKTRLSRIASLTLHWFGGIPTHDSTNGFKLYARWFLDRVRIESRTGFALELTVKAHRMGLPVREVPTVWRDRRAGRSRFRLLAWLPHYLKWWLIGMTLRLRPRPATITRRT